MSTQDIIKNMHLDVLNDNQKQLLPFIRLISNKSKHKSAEQQK